MSFFAELGKLDETFRHYFSKFKKIIILILIKKQIRRNYCKGKFICSFDVTHNVFSQQIFFFDSQYTPF